MLGAIAGDIIGSPYEFSPLQTSWDDFPLFTEKSKFTDDTVMTIAVAEAFRKGIGKPDLHELMTASMREYGARWPRAGYGGKFARWLTSPDPAPYNSYGNGSTMRVSPAGWLATNIGEAEALASQSAVPTHNHPEGIKGAQAVAGAIYLARSGSSRAEIRDYVTARHGYDLSRGLADIQCTYGFDETCQGSVPEAITAFLESNSFEEAVRKAIWLGGDADTQAAIAGSIAEAFYGGVPEAIATKTLTCLSPDLRDAVLAWQTWLTEYGNSR